ncbi:MAG: NUDIX hydrolase [Desulfosalsimonas sp.]
MNSWTTGSNSSGERNKQEASLDPMQLRQRLKRAPIESVACPDRFFMASVILLLYEKNSEPWVLTVLKSESRDYPWSNQVALPGGHMDNQDDSPLDTALRELTEELGITPDHLEVTGTMGHFFTIRQTVIECFVAVWDGEKSGFFFDDREIARVIEIPVAALRSIHESGGFSGRIPDMSELTYPYDGVVIWGVTARMIHFLLEHVI